MATMTSPPKPSGDYLTGSLLEYARDPLGFLTRCAREYGDVVRLRFLNLPVYLLPVRHAGHHPVHLFAGVGVDDEDAAPGGGVATAVKPSLLFPPSEFL